MKMIPAIYDRGVFRPLERVDLPDDTPVEIVVPEETPPATRSKLDAVLEVLSRGYHSERRRLAGRGGESETES